MFLWNKIIIFAATSIVSDINKYIYMGKCNKKLKVFSLPIEEFEKKCHVDYSVVVPSIPKGHVAKIVSVRSC